jgi:hypothetical protein
VIDLYFFDREGNPIAGKVPTQLRVIGGDLSGTAAAACQRAFIQFATAYRLGLYQSLTRRQVIDRFTVLLLMVNQGVFSAQATVLPNPGGPFYGGIVLELHELVEAGLPYLDDVHFDYVGSPFSRPRGADAYPALPLRRVLPEAQAVGSRSVPGVLGDEGGLPTNMLLFRIERRGDLSQSPVASGLVKISRIRSPLVGPLTSQDALLDRRYLVSASPEESAPGSGQWRYVQFALCGQALPVPPTPLMTLGGPPSRLLTRMHTVDFPALEFGLGNLARGLIVLAVHNYLYGYDMGNVGAGWQLLNEAPLLPSEINEFGFDFTVASGSLGSLEITCSGTNGFGAMSGFEVRLVVSGGGRTLTGALTLAGYTPPADTSNDQFVEVGGGTLMATGSGIDISVDAGEVDTFVGGMMNVGGARTRTLNSSYNGTSVPETAAVNWTLADPRFGFVTLNASASQTPPDAPIWTESAATQGPVSADPSNRHAYLSIDAHRSALAMRQTTQRTGVWAASMPEGFLTGAGTAEMAAASRSVEIIGRDAAVEPAYSFGDILSRFGALIQDAGTYSEPITTWFVTGIAAISNVTEEAFFDLEPNVYNLSAVDPQPDSNSVFNALYVDARTGGYIGQVFVEGELDGSGIVKPLIDLVIGNEDGAVPLLDVLNEWIAQNGGTRDLTHVFIARESAKDVMLI